MGLFDGYFDPEQFGEGGGLLGRLLALQQQQGQYQPSAGFDQVSSNPQTPLAASMLSPLLSNYGQPAQTSVNWQNSVANGEDSDSANLARSTPAPNPVMAQYTPTRPVGIPLPPVYVPGTPENDAFVHWVITAGRTIGGLGGLILNNQDTPADSGDKSPTSPVGRRGNPIDVKPGTNQPAVIGGRLYTGHAADQMQGRGITPTSVEETIRNGQASPGNNAGETEHIANGVKVVTGADGQVITVITVER
jgi:hypothetical protein